MQRKKKTTRRRIKSVEVGFRTLRVLEAANGPLPLVKIAAEAGMAVSKAYIYLSSFVNEGLVQQDPTTGHYGLGPFATQLGFAAIRQLDVVDVARQDLETLNAATRCAAILTIWGNRGPTIVLKVDGEGQGSMVVRLGHVLSPTTSASGRVFLAYKRPAEVQSVIAMERRCRDLAQRPQGREISPNELKALLETVRQNGYAESEGGARTGFSAIAAPIFDHTGSIVAAIGTLGPIGVVANEQEVIRHVKEAAARASARLGYSARAADDSANDGNSARAAPRERQSR
jgi:DNA-binding IclR family transcriptional regulator